MAEQKRRRLGEPPAPCPGCEGHMIPLTKRRDGSMRWVCATEGFGAFCMGEIVEKKDGTLLVGGDGYA